MVDFRHIGTIHSDFKQKEGVPIQSVFSKGSKGWIEILPEYTDGLKDLDGFSHIFLIYHFHKSSGHSNLVKPFLDDEKRGVFSTRAPRRPNPIGLSIVKLEQIEDNKLFIRDVDIIDGTPLLDIKPYVERFDSRENARSGWLDKRMEAEKRHFADSRFR